MRFQGRLTRDGKWWLAEVPIFDAMTQGRTRAEALEMIADWFAALTDRRRLHLEIHERGPRRFEIGSDDAGVMIGLLLRRQRHKSGLSLAEVAERLGARSRNAYARYEQGVSVPTIDKLDALLRAVAPDTEILLTQTEAA